jgi:hypothetical protein
MRGLTHLSVIPALFLAIVSLTYAHTATASGYNYYVDYFKVTGNMPGSQQDDFNDGNISPWIPDSGTVVESGGTAIIKSPGSTHTMGTITEEYSDMESAPNGAFSIAVGAGDATATSRWVTENVKPGLGQTYIMSADFEINTGNPATDGDISFHLGIINADQVTATAVSQFVGQPVPTGLYAFFTTSQYFNDTDTTLDFQVATITDTSLFDLESLFMSLIYDDDSQEVSASIVFGDDEDATPWHIFNGVEIPEYTGGTLEFDEWELGASSFSAVPIPAAAWLFGSGLLGLIGLSRRRCQGLG